MQHPQMKDDQRLIKEIRLSMNNLSESRWSQVGLQ